MYTLTSLLYMLQRDERKAPINKLYRNNAPKTQQVYDFTQRVFSHHKTGRYVCLRNKFAYLGALAKVSDPAYAITPCYHHIYVRQTTPSVKGIILQGIVYLNRNGNFRKGT